MATQYGEFIRLYEEFRTRHPNHPLMDDLRARIMQRRFPSDEWLRSRALRMKVVMRPLWVNSPQTGQESVPDS